MLPIFFTQCYIFWSDFDYKISITFINDLNEDVLIRDKNFSKGIVPFFVNAGDTFELSHSISYSGESMNWERGETLYEAYLAGPNNKFDILHSRHIVSPSSDSSTFRYLNEYTSAIYLDTFRINK